MFVKMAELTVLNDSTVKIITKCYTFKNNISHNDRLRTEISFCSTWLNHLLSSKLNKWHMMYHMAHWPRPSFTSMWDSCLANRGKPWPSSLLSLTHFSCCQIARFMVIPNGDVWFTSIHILERTQETSTSLAHKERIKDDWQHD